MPAPERVAGKREERSRMVKGWIRGLLAVLVLIGVVPAHGVGAMQEAAAGARSWPVTLTEDDCSFLIQFDDDPRPRLGEIACGVLDVPENWSQPDGRRIEIRYAVLKSSGEDPAPDPVVYLEGGPGSSALTGIEALAGVFATMREARDIVLFDQRGTRLSSPLRCSAYSFDPAFLDEDAPPDDAAAPAAETPSEPAAEAVASPGSRDPYELLQRARLTEAQRAADCVRELTASGADPRQYNSIASANDTVALIDALGYEAFNLYGISYGTRLALVIMRDHPESGIRSVVLDSTFPPEVKGFERYPEEPHEVVIQLFADCAFDPACNAAYPNLKRRFIALLPRLREAPVLTEDGTAIDDGDLIEVMQALSGNVAAVPYVPRMIDELERGETGTIVGIVTGALFDGAEAATEGIAEASPPAGVAEATPGAIDPELAASVSPARRFLLEVQARIAMLPEDASHRLFSLLLHLDKQQPSRQALADLIRRGFPSPEQARQREDLFAALAALDDGDVREVFEIVGQSVTLLEFLTFGTSQAQFNSVECNEEIPFQSFEQTVANANDLEIPEMARGVLEFLAGQFAVCEVWPSGRAPAVEALPVASDVPTLIFAGAYDLQTPVSWNKSAFVTLPNARFVEFPMSGHGVITFSACADAVAAAFIADPTGALDSSCTGALSPAWAMPSDSGTTEQAAAEGSATTRNLPEQAPVSDT